MTDETNDQLIFFSIYLDLNKNGKLHPIFSYYRINLSPLLASLCLSVEQISTPVTKTIPCLKVDIGTVKKGKWFKKKMITQTIKRPTIGNQQANHY